MTPVERRNAKVINGSRRKRIAAGSGTSVQDVNRLLKQHKQMTEMMKKVGKMGRKGLLGALPPGISGGGMPPFPR
jgi:signal recognition particle subunit SRP54